ncbi:alpha/beta hydrolase [Nocardioides sp. TF02-7]|uniref:alpha/beta hydrolase n=1 Tax=Nocardioides sp. TF02-7 TaxID=2917724 RepID=UPI001F058D13|nr:alpha/beta hydrolase [Nocardioides sp. TF02-7]UMG94731.1 alpha/beta hydrolase [Nocardioides sp. TF02-7]
MSRRSRSTATAPTRSSSSAPRGTRPRPTRRPSRWPSSSRPACWSPRDGDGHTAYNRGNACIDDAVHAYLIDGTVPDDGLEC